MSLCRSVTAKNRERSKEILPMGRWTGPVGSLNNQGSPGSGQWVSSLSLRSLVHGRSQNLSNFCKSGPMLVNDNLRLLGVERGPTDSLCAKSAFFDILETLDPRLSPVIIYHSLH